MFVNDKDNEYFYNAKDKHDLCTGSKTKYGAKVLFFILPVIVQKHFMNKQQDSGGRWACNLMQNTF